MGDVIQMWYTDNSWAMGEWGVNAELPEIFDEDWSVWEEEDR